jgi:hypothetical protein
MLILSKVPKVEKVKKFRVKTLDTSHESYIEVVEIDNELLKLHDEIDIKLKIELELSRKSDVSMDSIDMDKDRNDKNITREKDIFLKAAIQLLDEPSHAKYTNKYRENPVDNSKSFYKKTFNTKKDDNDNNRILREDNIRYGWLKKASRAGVLASVSTVWKSKFVELRHGVFTYEDDLHGRRKVVKKNIKLTTGNCQCQHRKLKEEFGDCVFELSITGGNRRMWQAASARDRDAWIMAINSAMVKSSERFLDPSNTLSNSKGNTSMLLDPISNMNLYTKVCSNDGAAAPYADEISRYKSIQSAIKGVSNVEHYRHIVDQLKQSNLNVTVPVFFVKSHATCKVYIYLYVYIYVFI